MSRVLLALCVVALAGCKPVPSYAAPPAGSDPTSDAAEWFRSLKDVRGISCCDASDCRRTMVRPREDGGIEAWIGVEEYGAGAPDAWVRVPDEEVKSRGNRPPGVRGAVACFYAGRVACVDLQDGS